MNYLNVPLANVNAHDEVANHTPVVSHPVSEDPTAVHQV